MLPISVTIWRRQDKHAVDGEEGEYLLLAKSQKNTGGNIGSLDRLPSSTLVLEHLLDGVICCRYRPTRGKRSSYFLNVIYLDGC